VKKGKAIAFVAVGLVAGLVLGSVGVSYAATDTTTPVVGAGVRMGQSIRDAGARLIDILADLTGLSTDEIQAERAEGNTVADIAEANGVDPDEVLDAALAARKAILDAKVADGTITQEQADLMYERMSERVGGRMLDGESGKPSWGGTGRSGVGGRGQGDGTGIGGHGGRSGRGLQDGTCIAPQSL
jgi:hypothetical protein